MPVDEVEAFFVSLDSGGDGEVSIQEFLHGCLKLRGFAKARDVLHMRVSTESLKQRITEIERKLPEEANGIA